VIKFLIVAVLLTVLQTVPPVPRQAADSPASTSRKIQKKGNNNQAPPAPSQPPNNTTAAPTPNDKGQNQTADDAQHAIVIRKPIPVSVSTHRDWFDWGVWVFSGLLVVVGILQGIVLWRQAKLMKAHATHLENVANAANENIEVVKSKERARLVIESKPLNLNLGADSLGPVIEFRVKIFGETIAEIKNSGCVGYWSNLGSVLNDPDLMDMIISPIISLPTTIAPHTPPIETFTILTADSQEIIEIKNDRLFVGIRGWIDYQDVFGRNQTTRFRYIWKYFSFSPVTDASRDGAWEQCGTEDENKRT